MIDEQPGRGGEGGDVPHAEVEGPGRPGLVQRNGGKLQQSALALRDELGHDRDPETGVDHPAHRVEAGRPDPQLDRLTQIHRWLPIVRQLHGSGRTVTYQSERLNRLVGLPNLRVAFNGYAGRA